MFKILAKQNLLKITQNATLAIALILGVAQGTKAEETKINETLQISCNPFASSSINTGCASDLNLESETEQVAQTRRGRRRKSKVQGYYGGFGLGAMFPSGAISIGEEAEDIDFQAGFNGSVFGGINFNKNLGAELEFTLGFGSGDTDNLNDSVRDAANEANQTFADANIPAVSLNGDFEGEADYSVFALYVSPKFNLPLSEKINIFISPGIGLSQTNVNYEAESDLALARDGSTGSVTDDAAVDELIEEFNDVIDEANVDRDSSRTGISFQIKAGASFQISDAIGVFGQVRYLTLPTESNDDFETDSLNAFSTQAGLTFNF